jgi:pimeloyl-ACP methyl ester carboxylesterase
VTFSALAHANPPADWIKAPDARAEFVEEPVFGGRVAVYRAGPQDAEAIVLVHGLGTPAARDWGLVIPALARRYQVIAIDLPGFGNSSKGNHHYTPDNLARALDAALKAPARFTLVGHSMGAGVAIAYAAAHPERVSRLVLVDAAGVLHRSVYIEYLALKGLERAIGADSPLFPAISRAIHRRAESWPDDDALAIERAGVRRRLLGGEPAAIAAVSMTGWDFSEELRAIRAPTLVVWGARDRIAPPRTGQALASAIPQARLVVLDAVAHAPQIEAPLRFAGLLMGELDGALVTPPYALAAGPVQGGREARCQGAQGQQFSGDYETLVIDECGDASIVNARIGRLEVVRSTVRIVNSHIRDDLQASRSRIEMTGGSVGGSVALDATSIDAAATHFSRAPVNRGDVPVVLRLSIAEMSQPGNAHPLHDIFRLAPGETLIR